MWPVPFGGIRFAVAFETTDLLRLHINKLLACGHCHNFAVQHDGLLLHVSENALACLGAE